jgi:hypothetical protein
MEINKTDFSGLINEIRKMPTDVKQSILKSLNDKDFIESVTEEFKKEEESSVREATESRIIRSRLKKLEH